MLKKTSNYQCGNVAFVEDKDGITLFCPETTTGAFNQPQLAAMYEAIGINTFCNYNEAEGRVEMKVYHYGN